MSKKSKVSILHGALMGIAAASAVAMLAPQDGVAKTKPGTAHKKEPCYGINKCKGTGDCGSKSHSCAGKNECKGKGWIKLQKETCLRIQGGRLKP